MLLLDAGVEGVAMTVIEVASCNEDMTAEAESVVVVVSEGATLGLVLDVLGGSIPVEVSADVEMEETDVEDGNIGEEDSNTGEVGDSAEVVGANVSTELGKLVSADGADVAEVSDEREDLGWSAYWWRLKSDQATSKATHAAVEVTTMVLMILSEATGSL
jgi:hypothetical protein